MAETKIDDGGYAFPWKVTMPSGSFNPIRNRTVPNGEVDNEIFPGMSLRDHFAGQALASVMQDRGVWDCREDERFEVAVRMYNWADAMIAARKGRTDA